MDIEHVVLAGKLLGKLSEGPVTRIHVFRDDKNKDHYDLEFLVLTRGATRLAYLHLRYGQRMPTLVLFDHPHIEALKGIIEYWVGRAAEDLTWEPWLKQEAELAVVCGGPDDVTYVVKPENAKIVGFASFVEASLISCARVCASRDANDARSACKAYAEQAASWREHAAEDLFSKRPQAVVAVA